MGFYQDRCRCFPLTTGGTSMCRRHPSIRIRRASFPSSARRRGAASGLRRRGSPGSVDIYGFPYLVVDGSTPRQAVQFAYCGRERRGQPLHRHQLSRSIRFLPRPATTPHWIEGGAPGNVDQRSSSDRHFLIVDRDARHLYELYNVFFDGTRWHAGSGAFFDMNTNGRRPDGWTSADAAGLAILPGSGPL